jgi:transcriptional regulator with XRE-family HTH domain
VEICPVKETIGYRIRKLRESKDFSQENMAGELGISTSAYSKIERGVTDTSVGRLNEIAKILEVDAAYFFQDQSAINKINDPNKNYGFATKSDIEELTKIINKLKQELAGLKGMLPTIKSRTKKPR